MNPYSISMIHIYVYTTYDIFQSKIRILLIGYHKSHGVGINVI